MPEPVTSQFDVPDLPSQFRKLLAKCRDLYVSSGELAAREHAALLSEPGDRFVQLMDDLHKALLVKVFVAICECDRRWSKNEKFLAEILLFHLWSEWLEGEALQEALQHMSEKAMSLNWYALVRPFDQIAPLRERIAELETIVTRLANIVARADGPIRSIEAARIRSIQDELHLHLREIPIDEPGDHEEADRIGAQAIDKVFTTANQLPATQRPTDAAPANESLAATRRVLPERSALPAAAKAEPSVPAADQLTEALAELERLIGLTNIKDEVRTLANFLKVQAKRKAAGLAATDLSLHMVFGGNPGTGKTTVARIVGKIFSAMGILAKGHLIETDRSGLVAEYAGQTGPKCQKKVDEALDGVLFIDEAYTLIAAEGDDPYGNEAVQTLLKRMEDNRDRLIVILAGYPDEMQTLLGSNPGLSSRFSRQLDFIDYTPLELALIFGQMCQKNQYQADAAVRAKAILGLNWLHAGRNAHFGNGRTVRNLFEDTVRRQANRIAAVSDLSVEQLSALAPVDVHFAGCPADLLAPLGDGTLRFHITCPHCNHGKDIPQRFLGQGLKCPKCKQDFVAQWGAPVPPEAES